MWMTDIHLDCPIKNEMVIFLTFYELLNKSSQLSIAFLFRFSLDLFMSILSIYGQKIELMWVSDVCLNCPIINSNSDLLRLSLNLSNKKPRLSIMFHSKFSLDLFTSKLSIWAEDRIDVQGKRCRSIKCIWTSPSQTVLYVK